MRVSATGHRPDKLGGWDNYGDCLPHLTRFAKFMMLKLDAKQEIKAAISGLALGWDTAWALAALELRIPLIAAIPFDGQHSRWRREQQELYDKIVGKAHETVIVTDVTTKSHRFEIAQALDKRNRWMVDNSELVAGLHNGTKGGTNNCVIYAKFKERRLHNVWDNWVQYNQRHNLAFAETR